MRKFLWITCCAVLIICLALTLPNEVHAAEIVDSGTCGENLTWALDDEGTLTISGTGPMYDYNSGGSPWYSSIQSIQKVVIEDGVTTIGNGAFEYCSNITSVTIPDSVTTIGGGAFSGCSSLTGVWVNENNPNYSSDSYGVLFDRNKTKLIQAPGALSGVYTIPDGVTTIGNEAFEYCSNITSVTISDSVITIGTYAFNSCSNLTSVTIPNSLTSIGNSTFNNCISLTSITIPDSVTSIGGSAFSGCSSLTGVWANENNPNYSSDSYGVLFDRNKTKLIQAPGALSGVYTIPDGVTTIGNGAFEYCNSITSVTIPDSITTISAYAFYFCDSLTSVTIPDGVASIGNSAFYGCNSLTSITIPNSVTSIGDCAFYGCSNIPSVTIPNSVTSIGYGTFFYCYSLTTIVIHKGVDWIGYDAFVRCSNIQKVLYAGTKEDWEQILIESGNEALQNATVIYDFTGFIPGDMDGDFETGDSDALYLLRHTLFPERYPINGDADVNGDGDVTDADALYLLRHTLFPERYPLYKND